MKQQDDQPFDYSADSTDQYSNEVDGDIVLKKQVRQEEEDHPDYSVDDKSPHGSQPRYQKQNYQYNQDDEDDRLHKATISPQLLRSRELDFYRHLSSCSVTAEQREAMGKPLFTELLRETV